MIKKQTLAVLVLLCAGFVGFGQPWVYDFGTSTGTHPTSSISTTFLTGTPINGGTYRVRTGAAGGTIVLANPGSSLGTQTELQIQSATSTSTNKFGVYDWSSPSTVAYFKTKIRTTSSSNGNLNFSLGINTIATSNTDYTAHYNNSISSFTIVYTTGAISSIIRRINGSNQTIVGSGYAKDTDQNIEVYANNSSVSTIYVVGATSYTLNSQQWDLWVDGIKISPANGWPTAGTLPVNTNLTGFGFFAQSSISNSAYIYLDDLEYSNSLPVSTDEVDWCNLQFPTTTQTITHFGNFDVYAQVLETGVTEAVGQGAGIEAWIGYNTTNNDPELNDASWTWIPANYNVDGGNNDEYHAEIGSSLPTGTYYYASRFRLNGGPFVYGGTGGIWNNDSVQIIVEPDQVNFCNVQYPKSFGITTGSYFEVYAQALEPGITDSAGQGSGIQAWIGYNTIGINHQPWDSLGWTWIEANYNPSCLDCNGGQNDEYYAEIGCGLPAGTYYYASRFQLNGSDYSYGGIQSDGVGNFWDATNNNGTLTITDPPLADVVITEIMYNTSGFDDEWIEICNVSGSAQDISNYTIVITGGSPSGTVFTFPCDTTISNGACITIDLGNGGAGVYNDDCTFTATYSNGLSTGTLVNSSRTITLYAANGTTETDSVTYNNSDGGDGNGSSLHVIDASLDNSNTGSNWQEVAYGGSSGTNSLIPNCLPAGVEINVEGNLGNYPDIADGDSSPSSTNNTLFAAQFVGASQSKSYRIQSLFSTAVIISNITITGHSADFTVTSAPASPVPYLTPSILEITFSPTISGTRTAVVHIFNNDADESEYTFTIQGNGLCLEGSNTITPSSGPIGTIVTVTGTNLSTATASFNGISATVNHISATEMEVTVPSGAVTGNLEIVDDQPCTSTIPFTVTDNQIGSCEGGSALTEIFISEVTDATYGGLTYIELYNPTSSDIDLSSYSIDIYINGNTDPLDTNHYKTQPLSGTIYANQTFVISTGYSGSFNCDSQPGGNGSLSSPDGFNSTTLGGINKKDNEHDYIGLLHTGVLIDEFGVFGDTVWMDTLHTAVSGDRGFDFRRKNTATLFSAPFDDSDWDIIDWVGTGSGSCGTNDYSDIGIYDFSTGTPPTIDTQPMASSSTCDLTATLTVSATEGLAGGNPLTYQWYYSTPGDSGWTVVPSTTPYSGETSNVLTISNTLGLNGYQYYCQVRENDATCYKATNAVKLDVYSTTWDGTTWSNGLPTLGTIATLNGNYNTGTNGSFSACSLIVNATYGLTVTDGRFVEVENNVTVDGSITVETKGAFVQNDDSSVFIVNSGGNSLVRKSTAALNHWYDYTYWSSPVEDATIGVALFTSDRRYWFDASNYLDVLAEVGNTGFYNAGQDDIDDNNDDWQVANSGDILTPGVGYAATHSKIGFLGPGIPYDYDFAGPFNNGVIFTSIAYNGANGDNDWNFIGNPYPSAIDFETFYLKNSSLIGGAAYLWTHNSDVSSTNSGNEVLNFSQTDYAIVTAGSGNIAAISGGPIPTNYIGSGQGFFVSGIANGDAFFDNSMRMADASSNDQFFKVNNNKSKSKSNKLWIDLNSDHGIFSEVLFAYVNGATNDFDGMAYDAVRNLSAVNSASLYSSIEGTTKKFAIQGKSPERLDLNEVIKLGFITSINVPTLFTLSIRQIEGDFLSSNPIYLKDNFLNKVHNLTASDYSFTSEVGEFKDRFEIMFRSETLSDTEALLNLNKLTIIELNDGRVQLKTNTNLTIKSVQILDLLGRTLYQLKGTSPTEIYNLNNLSQSTYIAKVELSNGQIVIKKAIKRN